MGDSVESFADIQVDNISLQGTVYNMVSENLHLL